MSKQQDSYFRFTLTPETSQDLSKLVLELRRALGDKAVFDGFNALAMGDTSFYDGVATHFRWNDTNHNGVADAGDELLMRAEPGAGHTIMSALLLGIGSQVPSVVGPSLLPPVVSGLRAAQGLYQSGNAYLKNRELAEQVSTPDKVAKRIGKTEMIPGLLWQSGGPPEGYLPMDVWTTVDAQDRLTSVYNAANGMLVTFNYDKDGTPYGVRSYGDAPPEGAAPLQGSTLYFNAQTNSSYLYDPATDTGTVLHYDERGQLISARNAITGFAVSEASPAEFERTQPLPSGIAPAAKEPLR